MDNNVSDAQPVPPDQSVQGKWNQGLESGWKKQFKDMWENLDPLQKWSMYAIVGLGGLLFLLMVGFGIRDLIVLKWPQLIYSTK